MGIRYDKDQGTMDVDSTTQTATTKSGLALHSLEPRSMHSTISTVPRLEWKSCASSSILVEPSLRSPTSSNSSQGSYTESGSMTSTAPSSPRSPIVKYEFSDHPLQPRKGTSRPTTEYRDVKLPAIQGASEETVLPGFSSLLRLTETPDNSTSASFAHMTKGPQQSPTPEPLTSGEYVLSGKRDFSSRQDPITECLNQTRRIQKTRMGESFTPLVSPFSRGLYIELDYSQPHSFRTTNDKSQRPRCPSTNYSPQLQHSGVNKRRNKGHCNKRYTKEQHDYIRYHVVDVKNTWREIQTKFDECYPDPDFLREVQGLQGVMYRQNKVLPKLDVATNSIVYLPNGHMDKEEMQVRQQVDKRAYGLINLFTEDALTYPWVKEEHRRKAAELVGRRQREREEAKRRAIETGLWEETTAENSCGCCFFARRATR